jgi:hypothetical protein
VVGWASRAAKQTDQSDPVVNSEKVSELDRWPNLRFYLAAEVHAGSRFDRQNKVLKVSTLKG